MAVGLVSTLADSPLISERGRALIIAAAIMELPGADDPKDDIGNIARQLLLAQEEIDTLTSEIKRLRVTKP